MPVLLDLLDAVLKPPPEQRIIALEVLNPFNDKETADDRLSIVDIKARDPRGRRYNVEMQMHAHPAYLERVLYYWASLYRDQMREGDDYGELKSTISICFVNAVMFPGVPDYHLDFQLRSSHHPQVIFSSFQSMHLVELPKFESNAADLTDPLDRWCYFLTRGADLDSNAMPAGLRTPALQRAMEVLIT